MGSRGLSLLHTPCLSLELTLPLSLSLNLADVQQIEHLETFKFVFKVSRFQNFRNLEVQKVRYTYFPAFSNLDSQNYKNKMFIL